MEMKRRDILRLSVGAAASFAAAVFWPVTWAVGSNNSGIKKNSFPKPNGCIVTVKGDEHKAEVRDDRIYWPPRSFPGRQVGSTVTM
jgi:hypothetical protein